MERKRGRGRHRGWIENVWEMQVLTCLDLWEDFGVGEESDCGIPGRPVAVSLSAPKLWSIHRWTRIYF